MKKYKPYLNRVDLVKTQVEREELREQEAKRKRSRSIQEQNRQRWLKYQEQLRSELAARYFHSVMSTGGESFSNTRSLLFDGTDDYVDCGTVAGLNSTSNFCASVWFKYTGTLSGTDNIMLSGGSGTTNDFYIQPVNATTIRYQVASANTNFSVTSMAQNTWIHLFLAHIGTTVTLYMNGVLQGGATRPIPTSIGTDFSIGRYGLLGGIYYFQGNIDEVAVWNTDQSANVSAIYNSGVPNDISSLSPLSWWRFEEGSGTTATDSGTGGNNGSIDGATYSTDVPS